MVFPHKPPPHPNPQKTIRSRNRKSQSSEARHVWEDWGRRRQIGPDQGKSENCGQDLKNTPIHTGQTYRVIEAETASALHVVSDRKLQIGIFYVTDA